VVAGDNPSFDYYLAPRLALHPGPPIERLDLRALPSVREAAPWTDTFVIFCRYVSRGWLATLHRRAPELAGVGLFIDDDIAALARSPDAGWRYRWKLHRHALSRWPRLAPMLDRVWVSTTPLAELWGRHAPVLLPPIAGELDLASTPQASAFPLVGLHATSSHGADQRWLEPVVRGVLAADPAIKFEVVAGRDVARRWAGDPRVRVIPYRSWPDYRAETAAHGRDLLLAPTMPGPVNAARAAVKRIDAARCGAALLVSDPMVFEVSDDEAGLGMAAPLEAGSWIDRILALMGDEARRRALIGLNRTKLIEARRTASSLFVGDAAATETAWRLA
jgi:hypothetical protein